MLVRGLKFIKHKLDYVIDVKVKKKYIGKKEEAEFASFGENSIIYKPLLRDNNRGLITVGKNTTILSNSRIQLYPQLVDETPHIVIGDGCYLGYYLTILAGADITIGNFVLMASNIIISSENHGIDPEDVIEYMDQKLIGKEVSIGDGCWIGEKVCILPGTHIGKKTIVGAGSVVTKDIPDYCIAVGNPARVIKKYSFETHRWEKV